MDSLVENLYNEDLFLIKPRPFVVLGTPWKDIPSEERQQLFKILAAVKLSPDAVQIVEQSQLDLGAFPDKPDRLLYFGNNVPGLTKYELIQVHHTAVILSDPLKELIVDEALRKKLWSGLRQLFGI